MLTTLRIKNLALVDDLTLELRPGLNAISGETGAGKSILIGALNLTLGERADRTLIRSGADSCTVEAVFDITRLNEPVSRMLESLGLDGCEDNQLLIRRVFSATGANKQFVNGSPTTLTSLKQIGELLVDIHGPHDHQSLLHPGRQLAVLDAFGDLGGLRGKLTALLQRKAALEDSRSDLVVDGRTYEQQLDLLRHQVREIETARFQPGEEEELESEHSRVSNAARLLEISQRVLGALGESEDALIDRASALGRDLTELSRIDESAAALLELQTTAVESWRELQNDLHRYADRLDLDPERLAELEERLDLLQTLKRKYGGSIEEINEFGTNARQQLETLESRDESLAEINAELERLQSELGRLADALTRGRRKVAPDLGKSTTRELQALGFLRSHFDIQLEKTNAIGPQGQDECEFLFAPNVGEPPRPLRAIASSGEMARVMLAVKTVLAVEDEIPVLVFDEVDANVGGETASVVGQKMREIGARRQVLCVTHLPAVAAAADSHYVVRKSVKQGRTVSDIQLLDADERAEELARMLGGQSETARKHAQALLGSASD